MLDKNVCSKYGGKIVAEAIENYGTIFYLRKDGTIGRKLKTIKYEHSGDWMFYCSNCGENYEERDILAQE